MRVAVRLFAAGRELAGAAECAIELAAGATVADVRRALARKHSRAGAAGQPLAGGG